MKRDEETEAIEEERRRLARLRLLVDLTVSELYQDRALTLSEARLLIRSTERAVLAMFPGQQSTFDLLLLPRFERILFERWGRGLQDQVN